MKPNVPVLVCLVFAVVFCNSAGRLFSASKASASPTFAEAAPRGAALKRGMKEGSQDEAAIRAKNLYDVWTTAYGVEKNARRTLKQSSHVDAGFSNWSEILSQTGLDLPGRSTAPQPGSCPPAPHLQCCDRLSCQRAASEKRGPNGEPPPWSEPQPSSDPEEGPYPRPPWIRGHPRDNLPLTHRVQTDIWLNQFPPGGCSAKETRFLITWWRNPRYSGFGSQLHLMTGVLGLALRSGRVLVLLNNSMERAEHEGCADIGQKGSLACYFLLPSAKDCEARVMEYWGKHKGEWHEKDRSFQQPWYKAPRNTMLRIMGNETFAKVSSFVTFSHRDEAYPSNWGEPWRRGDGVLNFGFAPWRHRYYEYSLKANWWRAQGIRFLLRWPSPYLCHLLNFARHQTYGRLVAQSWVSQEPNREADCKGLDTACPVSPPCVSDTMEQSSSQETPKDVQNSSLLLPKAYIPHPLIQIYYRGTDKNWMREMKFTPFGQYLATAGALAQNIFRGQRKLWLISEDERVFTTAKESKQWALYWLAMERKHQGQDRIPQWTYARQFGVRDIVEASLCNLLLCESSDAQILPLESNWGRVINELRITGGGLRTPLYAVNYNENP